MLRAMPSLPSKFAPLAISAVAATVLVLLPVGPAAATPSPPIHCGMKITSDTTLDRDLVGCKSDGIVIGADGITLDLDGHTIEGDGKLSKDCPEGAICDDGVVSIGHSHLTIENGTIENFALGGLIFGGAGDRIAGLTSTGNQFGGLTISAADSSIAGSTFSHNGSPEFGPGLDLHHAQGASVRGDTFAYNTEVGVLLESSHAIVAHDRLVGNGNGITLIGSEDRVLDDVVGRPHCGVSCQFGISLEGGHGNTIAGNRVDGAPIADIRVANYQPNPPTRDNVVRDNVLDAGRFGVLVQDSAKRTLLAHNVSRGASRVGFAVKSPTTEMVGNRG
jgi:large repetitive protein